MKCSQLMQILEKKADKAFAMDWDNVGLLVGSSEKEVAKVFLALDATDGVVQEAIQAGADLLLTHHPLIFRGIKHVTAQDFIGRRIIDMVRADMAYYAMHTNFDVQVMAGLAADKIGLQECGVLDITGYEGNRAYGIGRVGELPRAMSLAECCDLVKTAFGLSKARVAGDLSREVKRAAICPGSGKSEIQKALDAGADVYVTGDIDYHEGIDMDARGMSLIDAGHYGLEQIFVPYMEAYLREQAPEIEVAVTGGTDPYQIV